MGKEVQLSGERRIPPSLNLFLQPGGETIVLEASRMLTGIFFPKL
jgi:hypothetical protein